MTTHAYVPSLETDEEREQREYDEYREREARAAERGVRRSGWRKGQPRCNCRKFIPTPTSVCNSCGFDNGRQAYPI